MVSDSISPTPLRTLLVEHDVGGLVDSLESLIQANPDAQLVTTADGSILYANDAALALLSRCGGAAPAAKVPFAIDTQRSVDIELETESGSVFAEVRSVPIVWASEPAFLASIRDNTQRHRLAEELHAAERLEALARLAGGVAHDFNNLMTVIVSASDALLGATQPEVERTQRAQEIFAAAERARALTQQLLAFSRHDYAKTSVVTVQSAIRGLEASMRDTLIAGTELSLALPEQPAHVRVDPTLFAQVVAALVQNAAVAMPDGGRLEVSVRTEERHEVSGARLFVKIRFEDSGCGIPQAHVGRIFEPFFTTDKSGTHLGLGLSTCYGIVRKAGGSIEVESKPGVGSAFTVLLPSSEAPAEIRDADAPTTARLGQLLLVEDDPLVRRATARTLRQSGYGVVEACDGEEASALMGTSDTCFSLVVSDIVMPRMNGIQLANLVRARCPEAKILFVTGYSERLDEAAEVGASHVLIKPFHPTELLSWVRRTLSA